MACKSFLFYYAGLAGRGSLVWVAGPADFGRIGAFVWAVGQVRGGRGGCGGCGGHESGRLATLEEVSFLSDRRASGIGGFGSKAFEGGAKMVIVGGEDGKQVVVCQLVNREVWAGVGSDQVVTELTVPVEIVVHFGGPRELLEGVEAVEEIRRVGAGEALG